MNLRPISYKEACDFIKIHHRHNKPPIGHKFSIALESNNQIIGVIMVGRPVSRMLDNGLTLEVNRCCTDGTKNACSLLYGASWRVAKNLGYNRIITYTLEIESGSSLKGAGWVNDGIVKGASWNRNIRNRKDQPWQLVNKLRWSKSMDR